MPKDDIDVIRGGAVGKEILVVEDDRSTAEMLVLLMKSEGYRAQFASNGLVALQRLADTRVDLVLMDYMMPVMDGCQLMQAIRARKELAAIPVLVLSALPEEIVREKCPAIEGFCAKPFDFPDLLGKVKRLLAGGVSSAPISSASARSLPSSRWGNSLPTTAETRAAGSQGLSDLFSEAVVELRTVFLKAKRIDLDKDSLEVEGVQVMTLESLTEVLRVLTRLWGDQVNIVIESTRGLLRVRQGAGATLEGAARCGSGL